eukprot:TRINITY_DN511_c0_g1_i1.p1 TRINITY_DN511_c0_g1~~TRINITY_DN511_c0_g1_i1.p1  ORF type:complete len:976 (+),score=263.02 TRINITY_DN511_c0_g1_i1:9-2936(+)
MLPKFQALPQNQQHLILAAGAAAAVALVAWAVRKFLAGRGAAAGAQDPSPALTVRSLGSSLGSSSPFSSFSSPGAVTRSGNFVPRHASMERPKPIYDSAATVENNNLLETEAAERAAIVSDVTYDISLKLVKNSPTYSALVIIRFTPSAGTFLDFTGKEITSLTVNRQTYPQVVWSAHRIQLPESVLKIGEPNEVTVWYTNNFDTNGSGFHKFVDPKDKEEYVYTHFEPFDAHRFFPCFDQPDIKATFSINIAAPVHWEVITTAPPSHPPVYDPSKERNHHYFHTSGLFSTYIFAVVAGPYQKWVDTSKKIPLGIYCRKSLSDKIDVEEIFEITQQGLEWYGNFFDFEYPWGKYDQIFVPEFNMGAMENTGCIVHNDSYIFRDPPTFKQRINRADVILHEMAHMWFGNLVTMKWWSGLWLNESFATYMAALATSECTKFAGPAAWQNFNSGMKQWAYGEDQLSTTHPIDCPVVDTNATFLNFDGITYGKGASVLKQLVFFIGMDAFKKGMQHYFKVHQYSNTTLSHFLEALEYGYGEELQEWAEMWLKQSGLNQLVPSFSTPQDRLASINISQSAVTAEHPTLRTHRVSVALYDLSQDTQQQQQQKSKKKPPATPRTPRPATLVPRTEIIATVEAQPETELLIENSLAPDFVFINSGDHAYAKILLDDMSLQFAVQNLNAFTDPLLRQLLWGTFYSMVRDQKMSSLVYLELVRNQAVNETDSGILSSLLRNSLGILSAFVPEELISAEKEAMFNVAWDTLIHTETSGDFTILWASQAVACAGSPASLEALVKLLKAENQDTEGKLLDQKMRWDLVVKCVAYGFPNNRELLDAELQRDSSDRGQRQVERANASEPSATVKAAEWARYLNKETLKSLHMMSAAMSGFLWLHQSELTEEFFAPFFSQLGTVFANFERDYALSWCAALMPQGTDDKTLAALKQACSDHSENKVLHRTLCEALDDKQRQRACRDYARKAR